jgi:hypothetical protein
MSSDPLRLSNYNGDAVMLLARVLKLFERDDQVLGDSVIGSVSVQDPGSSKQCLVSRIEISPKRVSLDSPEVSDYETTLFVKVTVSREALPRLVRLSDI